MPPCFGTACCDSTQRSKSATACGLEPKSTKGKQGPQHAAIRKDCLWGGSMAEAVSGGTLHDSLTGRLKVPTQTAEPDPTTKPTAIRSERYRVRFDHSGQAEMCAQTAGANRFVWNLFLAYNDWSYRMARKARGLAGCGPTSRMANTATGLWISGRTWQTLYKRFAA